MATPISNKKRVGRWSTPDPDWPEGLYLFAYYIESKAYAFVTFIP